MIRLIDHPLLQEIAVKHKKTPIQVALAWGISNGRSVIPKSTIEWQIRENLEADFDLTNEDIEKLRSVDKQARFNDPSTDFGYKLYRGLDGTAC